MESTSTIFSMVVPFERSIQVLCSQNIEARYLITWGAKIYAKVPNTAPPKTKPATKSLPQPLLPSLHITEINKRWRRRWVKSEKVEGQTTASSGEKKALTS